MNHVTQAYISVNFAQNSPFYDTPDTLSSIYPGLTYLGQVGELSDVHLYSFPQENWLAARGEVLSGLQDSDGVLHVEVQRPVQRVKRGEEEL
jgi:hypothetical protein